MRRRKLLIALTLIPLAILAVELFFGTRLKVAYHARGLGSESAAGRAAARDALLAIGRPAIDGVLPELVARNVADEVASGGAVVVAASVAEERGEGARGLAVRVERVLVATDPRALDVRAKEETLIRARDERVSPASVRIGDICGGRAGGRSIVVLGQRGGEPVVRSIVSVEGGLGPRILAAVEAELAPRGR